MIPTFFWQEFRRTFPLFVLLATATGVCLLLVDRWIPFGVNEETATRVMDALTVFAMLGAATTGGASTFASAFRDGPLRSIECLPISRFAIWSIRIFVCFISVAAACFALLLFRPAVLDEPNSSLLLMGSVGLVCFVAGCCLSLLVRASAVLTSVLAFTLAGLGLTFLLTLATYSQPTGNVDTALWVIGTAFFVVLFSFLSLRFFLAAEVDLPRRRFRNSLQVLCAVLMSGVFLTVLEASGITSSGERWITPPTPQVSRNGRFVSLLQWRQFHPSRTRVVIIDTETGTIVKTWNKAGIDYQTWAADGSLVAAVNGNFLDHVAGWGIPGVKIFRVQPSERKLFEQPDVQLGSLRAWSNGLLVSFIEAPLTPNVSTRFIRLDMEGKAETVLALPGSVWSVREEAGIRLDTGRKSTVLLRDNGELSKDLLQIVPPPREASETAAKKIASVSPAPDPSPGRLGAYVWSDYLLDLEDVAWFYYLAPDSSWRTARLFARQRTGGWKTVFDFNLAGLDLKSVSDGNVPREIASNYGLYVGVRNGLVVHLEEAARGGQLTLFDVARDRQFKLADLPSVAAQEIRSLEVDEHALESPGILIRVASFQPKTASRPPSHKVLPSAWIYEPGKTPLEVPVSLGPNAELLHMKADGTHIYYDDARNIHLVRPGSTPRRLWPQ